jgi:beta-glucosidase
MHKNGQAISVRRGAAAVGAGMGPASVWAQETGAPPVNLAAAEARADQTVKAMTADERPR